MNSSSKQKCKQNKKNNLRVWSPISAKFKRHVTVIHTDKELNKKVKPMLTRQKSQAKVRQFRARALTKSSNTRPAAGLELHPELHPDPRRSRCGAVVECSPRPSPAPRH
jgi:hypothetical protein